MGIGNVVGFFISVFLVPDSKVPIQGAYILKSEFEGSSRDLTLQELKVAYPAVRTSPMDDVNKWVALSKELDPEVQQYSSSSSGSGSAS